MPIYLYVKTHNQTGLKYLGKTIKSNPYKYPGSGKYWRRHLKLHGHDVSTEIIKECVDEKELEHWGRYYSELWDIVNSPQWANLKPESGEGGAWYGYVRIPDSEERIRRVATRKANNAYGQSKGLKWFNNGTDETMSSEAPDSTWARGRLPKMVECLRSIASQGGTKGNQVRWG